MSPLRRCTPKRKRILPLPSHPFPFPSFDCSRPKKKKLTTYVWASLSRILSDPTNPLLYTNRAMARLKMSRWDSVIEDCEECLRLSSLSSSSSTPGSKAPGSKNFKALYYLSQAHLPLKNYDQAVSYALEAHKICAETHDKSLAAVTSQVLKCKKERWEHREKLRRREEQELEGEVVEILRGEMEGLLKGSDDEAEKKETEKMYEDKIERIRAAFERAREKENQRRPNPPDWAIDDISFQVMVDPVMVSFPASPFSSFFFFFFFSSILSFNLFFCIFFLPFSR